MRRRLVGLAVFVVSSLLFLGVGELLMSRYLYADYYVWPPNFRRTFDPDPGIIHGVHFPTHLTINEIGMRGDAMPDDADYRIVTIGASTTICVYLDDSKAWPYRLQQLLNERLGAGTVWVGNAGRPGHALNLSLLQAEKLMEQYPEIDTVVMLIGAADMLIDVSATLDGQPVAELSRNEALRRAFTIYPDWDAESPWYARNVIGRAARLRNWHPLPLQHNGVFAMDEKGQFVAMNRQRRASASRVVHRHPDLTAPIARYADRVNAVIDEVRRQGRRVVFLTQPSLYKPDMTPEEEALLWGGGRAFFRRQAGLEYYSAEVLGRAMELYNEALLRVCRERDAECVDMAGALPRTAEYFYDDAHFTELGSERVAETLAAHFLSRTKGTFQLSEDVLGRTLTGSQKVGTSP